MYIYIYITDVAWYKFQRLKTSSKTANRSNAVICLKITPRKIQKLHPTPRQENRRRKWINEWNKKKMHIHIHGQHDNKTAKIVHPTKTPNLEIRWNPRISCITKKTLNQFATPITWMVSIIDELLSKDI